MQKEKTAPSISQATRFKPDTNTIDIKQVCQLRVVTESFPSLDSHIVSQHALGKV
jgi:hypothetical protein